MPGRIMPLVTNEIYHIINRGIWQQPIFFNKRNYQRMLTSIKYYSYLKPPIKLSYFLESSLDDRLKILDKMKKNNKQLIEIICYCLMPNHIHILLKQLIDNGISKFMSNVANSYTRYVNTQQERIGPLFQGKFKSIRIETDEQLTHVSRYIHLNPLTSYLVIKKEDLINYPYSSFPEYMGKTSENLCVKKIVLDLFKDKEAYYSFVMDQVDYQRKLNRIKHLVKEY